MAWFKVDDTLHGHPKVLRAGAAAVGVWTAAGSFCSAYKTDGFVPDYWLSIWGKTGRTAARRLVEVGLWYESEKDGERGYQFHDWADYQPSSDEVERERDLARERQRRSRERKARHAAGDHSMCDRCNAVARRDSHANVTRDNTRESQYPDPTRPDPSRPDKGQGQGRESGSGTGGLEAPDPSPAVDSPRARLTPGYLNNADEDTQQRLAWPYDPANPHYGGYTPNGWINVSEMPPHGSQPR